MTLMTFEVALKHYEEQLAEARALLMEYQASDFTPPWKIHEQQLTVAGLTRLRDKANDRLVTKHTSTTTRVKLKKLMRFIR